MLDHVIGRVKRAPWAHQVRARLIRLFSPYPPEEGDLGTSPLPPARRRSACRDDVESERVPRNLSLVTDRSLDVVKGASICRAL